MKKVGGACGGGGEGLRNEESPEFFYDVLLSSSEFVSQSDETTGSGCLMKLPGVKRLLLDLIRLLTQRMQGDWVG